MPSSAHAQEQQIPKELALALIQAGGNDGGEIIVGKMPPDFAAMFSLSPGARVLGSFATLSFVQVVLALPGSADSAIEFARRSLVEHGWQPRQPQMPVLGGLQYGLPRPAPPRTYCKTGSPDVINVATQFHGPETLLRLTRSTGSSACEQSPGSGSAMSSFSTSIDGSVVTRMRMEAVEAPLASVPQLWAPTDFRQSQACRQPMDRMGPFTQTQPLRTELTLSEVLAHYGRQLDSAGWKS